MNLLARINKEFQILAYEEPSSLESITELIEYSPISIPGDYLDVIGTQSEIEIRLMEWLIIRLWSAEGCIEMNSAYRIFDSIPNAIAIGDDEGGRALIYHESGENTALYTVSFNELDEEELIYISDSLENLLVNKVGVDKLMVI